MLPKEPRPLNVNDPRALGISTEDLDRFFEHRKHDRTASQGVRASTQSLKESARDLQLPSVSNLDAAGLERELLQARQRGDLPRIIATLQAKVKLRQLGRAERKKVLIDLLLELLNARKIASIEECLKQYEPVVAGTEDDQSEYFSLCFELLSIVVVRAYGSRKSRRRAAGWHSSSTSAKARASHTCSRANRRRTRRARSAATTSRPAWTT